MTSLSVTPRLDSSDIVLAAVSIIKCEPTELAYLSVDRDECRPVMLTRVDCDKLYVKVSKGELDSRQSPVGFLGLMN